MNSTAVIIKKKIRGAFRNNKNIFRTDTTIKAEFRAIMGYLDAVCDWNQKSITSKDKKRHLNDEINTNKNINWSFLVKMLNATNATNRYTIPPQPRTENAVPKILFCGFSFLTSSLIAI